MSEEYLCKKLNIYSLEKNLVVLASLCLRVGRSIESLIIEYLAFKTFQSNEGFYAYF